MSFTRDSEQGVALLLLLQVDSNEARTEQLTGVPAIVMQKERVHLVGVHEHAFLLHMSCYPEKKGEEASLVWKDGQDSPSLFCLHVQLLLQS